MHIPKAIRKDGKLSARAFDGVMVWYSQNQNGYRVLNKQTGEVIVSRDVQLYEE